ncbi:L,D-transpeptidase [Flavobacterium sp. SUN052]|uniref:L,D-transpeptidase n=1 Tax=Flavobacterium sp. SUN052 TaxID=3002441 RepID=UPI00237D9987|nr:L,D-transpeptidase [Flavobacterium sp. SUN052]MEC4005161.1 L,D-transpeptidase [Flavobacterium sp. SUN052]
MKNSVLLVLSLISLSILSCQQSHTKPPKKAIVRNEPKKFTYSLLKTKDWFEKNKTDSTKIAIVLATNRVDKNTVSKLDSIIVPTDFSGDIVYYLPFPLEVSFLNEVDKIILFSYATQSFGAYENGVLVYAGPTNMGRKKDPTPTGLFFTNWKAEKTTSTFNDEWDLKWNFNIENKLGVGFHEYELPGYPASHSCLRLQEKDAKFLYEFADQWILKDKENIAVKGTPVVVFGSYDFDAKKPWLEVINNPKALQFSADEIEKVTSQYLTKILAEQTIKNNYTSK